MLEGDGASHLVAHVGAPARRDLRGLRGGVGVPELRRVRFEQRDGLFAQRLLDAVDVEGRGERAADFAEPVEEAVRLALLLKEAGRGDGQGDLDAERLEGAQVLRGEGARAPVMAQRTPAGAPRYTSGTARSPRGGVSFVMAAPDGRSAAPCGSIPTSGSRRWEVSVARCPTSASEISTAAAFPPPLAKATWVPGSSPAGRSLRTQTSKSNCEPSSWTVRAAIAATSV